jgi:hypothetical protein
MNAPKFYVENFQVDQHADYIKENYRNQPIQFLA